MKLGFTGYVSETGEVLIRNRKQLQSEVVASGWKEFAVTITKKRKNRSYEQNRYYWGVVVAMIRDRFRELGNDVSSEETHDYLKNTFNYKEFVHEATGEVIKIPMSTADLTTSAFMDYLAKIQTFSAQILDIRIPDPNEQMELI